MSLRGPCVVRWLIGVCDADVFSLCCTHRTTAAVCHLEQRAAFTNFHGGPEQENTLKGPETLRGRIMSRRGLERHSSHLHTEFIESGPSRTRSSEAFKYSAVLEGLDLQGTHMGGHGGPVCAGGRKPEAARSCDRNTAQVQVVQVVFL